MSFWRRVPTFLPNLPLKLVPLSETQRAAYETTGFVKELVFKTVPQATKVWFLSGLLWQTTGLISV